MRPAARPACCNKGDGCIGFIRCNSIPRQELPIFLEAWSVCEREPVSDKRISPASTRPHPGARLGQYFVPNARGVFRVLVPSQREGCRGILSGLGDLGGSSSTICQLDQIVEYALSFAAAAREGGYRVCFFGTAARFAEQITPYATHVKIGEQPCWNPVRWDGNSKRMQLISSQRRRAERKGVTVTQESPQVMAQRFPERTEPSRRFSVIRVFRHH